MKTKNKVMVGILKTSMSADEVLNVSKVINKALADKDKRIKELEEEVERLDKIILDW